VTLIYDTVLKRGVKGISKGWF